MPLPTVFANLTGPILSQLDADFNAVGLLGTLPCTVTGTNNLVLSPAAPPQPTIVLQAQLEVSAIAVANNTGAVTANVAGTGTLNVYKDTPTGPVLLTGGEIVLGNLFSLIYDAALNSGIGGWHIETAPAAAAGTVTSVASGTGLTGGPITTSGTLSLAAVANNNLLANISGGSAAPAATALSAYLDSVFGNPSAQGSILARGVSLWAAATETAYSPALSFGGASVGITYSTQVGAYFSIGFLTIVIFNIVLSSKGSSTGNAAVSLPVTAAGAGKIGGGLIVNYSMAASVTTVPALYIAASGTTAALVVGAASTPAALTNANFTGGDTIAGVMVYFNG